MVSSVLILRTFLRRSGLWTEPLGNYSMALTKKERQALRTAQLHDGANRGDLYPSGEKTITRLIERGLLERFPHPMTGRPMFRTTAAGAAALAAPEVAVAQPARPKLKMLEPRVSTLDTSIAKLAKPKR